MYQSGPCGGVCATLQHVFYGKYMPVAVLIGCACSRPTEDQQPDQSQQRPASPALMGRKRLDRLQTFCGLQAKKCSPFKGTGLSLRVMPPLAAWHSVACERRETCLDLTGQPVVALGAV